jgi:hypothetical protein
MRVLPEVPVDRQQAESDGRDMLLQLEEALRLPVAGLLDRDSDVDAVLGVDPGAEDEGENPQNADGCGIAGSRHGTEARDKTGRARELPHRQQHRHRLMRQRAEQRDREQSVNDEKDRPERIDGYEVHLPPLL